MSAKLLLATCVILSVACVTAVPHTNSGAILITIQHDSGGPWPQVSGMTIYVDGVVEYHDSRATLRRRVDPNSEEFRRLLRSLDQDGFTRALARETHASPPGGGSGMRVRFAYNDVVAVIDPVSTDSAICGVMRNADDLYRATFGARYHTKLASACSERGSLACR